MPIPAPSTISIPAVPAKDFPDQWIYNLSVHAPTVSSARVSIELLPYNASEGLIGPAELMESLATDSFFQCVQEVPEALAAYTAVMAAVNPIREWLAAQAAAAEDPAP